MIYFYYFGFVYLAYMLFRMFLKTGKPIDLDLGSDLIDLGRQVDELREKNKQRNSLMKVFKPVAFIWVGCGIIFSDYRIAFISLLIFGLIDTWNNINKNESNRRVIYAICDVSRIIIVLIVLYNYFLIGNYSIY